MGRVAEILCIAIIGAFLSPIFKIILKVPFRVAEDAVAGWINQQIGEAFDLTSPSLSSIATWASDWGLALLVALIFGWLLVLVFRDRSVPTTTPQTVAVTGAIPIATALRMNVFWSRPYFSNELELDCRLFDFGETQITNISKDNRVILNLFLHIKSKKDNSTSIKLPANLRNSFGQRMGKDDMTSRRLIEKNEAAPEFLENPVQISPQETVKACLVFILDYPKDLELALSRQVMNGELEYEVIIEDAISGNSATIPNYGSYRGE